MIGWLYRYVFRGIGILFLLGMLTALISAISQVRHMAPEKAHRPAPSTRR